MNQRRFQAFTRLPIFSRYPDFSSISYRHKHLYYSNTVELEVLLIENKTHRPGALTRVGRGPLDFMFWFRVVTVQRVGIRRNGIITF